MPSLCQGTWDCQNCQKAVDNAITHTIYQRGFHIPAQKCEENIILFLMKGEMLVNSKEYAGVMLKGGEFILQAIASKFEILAMTECECIYYSFIQPELFCDFRFNHIMNEVPSPLIFSPLKIIPELQFFLNGSIPYLKEKKVCRDLLSLKRKELAFVLGYYYSDYDLATLVHPLSKYTTSFQYFILQNYRKVKTVEELAQLGGYTVSTLRRIFNNVFHEPVYEWMQARRKEGILDDLHNSDYSISEICYKYGFESLPHFSNFCKKSFGASPRSLRNNEQEIKNKSSGKEEVKFTPGQLL